MATDFGWEPSSPKFSMVALAQNRAKEIDRLENVYEKSVLKRFIVLLLLY